MPIYEYACPQCQKTFEECSVPATTPKPSPAPTAEPPAIG